jgi:hypothetical protein
MAFPLADLNIANTLRPPGRGNDTAPLLLFVQNAAERHREIPVTVIHPVKGADHQALLSLILKKRQMAPLAAEAGKPHIEGEIEVSPIKGCLPMGSQPMRL